MACPDLTQRGRAMVADILPGAGVTTDREYRAWVGDPALEAHRVHHPLSVVDGPAQPGKILDQPPGKAVRWCPCFVNAWATVWLKKAPETVPFPGTPPVSASAPPTPIPAHIRQSRQADTPQRTNQRTCFAWFGWSG